MVLIKIAIKVHLKDLYGDGFCCEDGNGYLLVLTNCGDTLAFEDGDFLEINS